MKVLLQHLLKLHMQPSRVSRSWVVTIINQQQEIRRILNGIPSLAAHAEHLFEEAYGDAVRLAAAETRIPARDFPKELPWTMDAALAFVPPDPSAPSRKRRARVAAKQ